MTAFRPFPNRDAWATIRGYVYQVDVSILRWLDLQPGEVLELERGEDIDLVLPGLQETDQELSRRLEQVKHHEVSLTLRSPEVLAAIANYHTYRANHPASRLSFQFTTNALAGQEKLSPMPGRQPALLLWNALRAGTLDVSTRAAALDGIRHLLTAATRPEVITSDNWDAMQRFFSEATDAETIGFIAGLSWSVGTAEPPDLVVQIQQRLLADGHLANKQAAEDAYQRLFVYVFNALTRRGTKQLTHKALLAQLAEQTLRADDAALLTSVLARVGTVEQRVASMERTLANYSGMLTEQRVMITGISSHIEQLVRQNGHLGTVFYGVEPPDLEAPRLPERRSERAETVERLSAIAVEHPWLALHGATGSGKTQLSMLLARRFATRTIWLKMHGLNVEAAGERIDLGSVAVTGGAASPVLADSYRSMCANLEAGALIVLDDLPRTSATDGLGTRLMWLAEACAAVGVHLLTSSLYPLPLGLLTALPEALVHLLPVPPFTTTEAAELLRAYGAPDRLLLSKPMNLLNVVAGQHPLLLTAMARFLAARGWDDSDETLDGLHKRAFATEVNDETMHQLLATVEDEESRELLYRLTLVRHVFALEEAQALAAVPPVVPRPRERLHALSGLWLQGETIDRFSISPLVANFGESELGQHTLQECHRVLGEHIINRGRLTPLQIVEAIVHFGDATQFNRAGAFFAWALGELDKQPVEMPHFGLLSAWVERSLPVGMDLGIRIYVRAWQIGVRLKRRMAVDVLLADLNTLVEHATADEAWALIGAVVATAGLLDADHSLRYLRAAIRLAPTGRLPNGRTLAFKSDLYSYEELIWMVVSNVETFDHLRAWLSVFEDMTPDQRVNALKDTAVCEEGSFLLAEWVWSQEADKPSAQRNWPAVLAMLEELEQRAAELGADVLWAGAVRAEVMVRADNDDDWERAVSIGGTALAQASTDALVQFLLRECVGRAYLNANQPEAAIGWLTEAVEQAEHIEAFPRVRMEAMFAHSRALMTTGDGEAAVQIAQRGVELAKTNTMIGDLDVVRALGELALAQWQLNGVAAAFEAWDEAAERLFACRNDRAIWQDACMIFLHTSGYFASLAARGEAPKTLASGESYDTPFMGMVLDLRVDRAYLYDTGKDAYVAARLAEFAEAVGRDARAAIWAARGVEWARDTKQWLALTRLGPSAITPLTLDDRYADILDTALVSGALTIALGTLRSQGVPAWSRTGEYDALLAEAFGERPGPLWRQAEVYASFLGVVPITFRLATLSLADTAQSKATAIAVVALCREVGASSTVPEIWDQIATCLERVFVAEEPAEELFTLVSQLEPDGPTTLRILARVGASLRVRGSPALALHLHQGLIPFMRLQLKNEPAMYRQVVTPFVIAFWRTRLAERRVHFRQPDSVEMRLNDALAHPGDDLARQVLEAVEPGLD